MIQFAREHSQYRGLYTFSIQAEVKKGNQFLFKEVKKLTQIIPLKQGKIWLQKQAVTILIDTITRYTNQREIALTKYTKFEDMDKLAIYTIRNKIINQTAFYPLCRAIVKYKICLIRLMHQTRPFHKKNVWDHTIPSLIQWAENQLN